MLGRVLSKPLNLRSGGTALAMPEPLSEADYSDSLMLGVVLPRV
jgi:hypothetical protein